MRSIVFVFIFALCLNLLPTSLAQGATNSPVVKENTIELTDKTKASNTIKKASTGPYIMPLYMGRVTAKTLVVHETGSNKAKKIATLKKNQIIDVVEISKSWRKVRVKRVKSNYMYGWVASKDLKKVVSFEESYEAPKIYEVISSANEIVTFKQGVTDYWRTYNNIYVGNSYQVNRPETYVDTLDFYIFQRNYLINYLPKQLTIETPVSKETLLSWEAEFQKTNPKTLIPVINYKQTWENGKLIFTDEISPSSYVVDDLLKKLGEYFAASIKNLTPEEKIHVIYDYIYYQFDCVGDYSTKMMYKTDLNSQQGSNGLAWIFYRLATESGLDVTTVEDKGHYYITWRTDNGEKVNIDLASDMEKRTKHGATKGLKDKKSFLAVEKNVISLE